MVVFLTVLFYAQLFPETPGLSASDRLGKELFHRECQLHTRRQAESETETETVLPHRNSNVGNADRKQSVWLGG